MQHPTVDGNYFGLALADNLSKVVNFGFAHIPRMLFVAEIFDVTNDPIAVSIFGAVRVMMITKYLSDLIHKLYAGIGSEFPFVFHDIDKIS